MLVPAHRNLLLADETELRARIPADLPQMLCLNEWRHPLLPDESPSDSEAYRQIAGVLATGDTTRYRPTLPPKYSLVPLAHNRNPVTRPQRTRRPGGDHLVSFGTYARRVRDRGLPYGQRYTALRCAVGHYCPIGFNATWSYLSTTGALRKDENALLRALDMLELSRTAWLTEMRAFADRRREEKRCPRRTSSAAETRYLHGYRWPGPESHQATFHAVGLLWAEHAELPFPETPPADKGDLVYLDVTLAGCISTYIRNGGTAGPGHADILLSCLPELRRHLVRLGYPSPFSDAFTCFRRLLKMTELIVNDISPPTEFRS
ncbi:hypothetical protein DPM19_34460 [Actinomadura craniellae]|uniref:Uncharacterized protein n=1 Tax=Actinomadura craniellae TaxID=2231787 RepID=A0A365GV34_9ACTN|nr:hypothetical protein [Actinomadura craniellae]RAY10660.1 hypothetical protein DPM19_34460 [Actinomadura craniellae]